MLTPPSSAWHTPGFSLSSDDPAPFLREDFGMRFPALVVCDHASNAVPRCLNQLGLRDEALQDHIAWDIGAAPLARRLAQQLQLPLIMAGFSRLVIDCNRALDNPASMLAVSDGIAVPANTAISPAQRQARVAAIYEPYHAAIDLALSDASATATPRVAAPALISVHSFTPQMQGYRRPWHCGILWDKDPRMPVPLLRALRLEPELSVGDNEPYSGRDPSDYTVSVHAKRRGWPNVCVEIRQDLLLNHAGVEAWSKRLAEPLRGMLDDKTLFEVANY